MPKYRSALPMMAMIFTCGPSLLTPNTALTRGTQLAGPKARTSKGHRRPMAWLATPTGKGTRQGQRRIGDANAVVTDVARSIATSGAATY